MDLLDPSKTTLLGVINRSPWALVVTCGNMGDNINPTANISLNDLNTQDWINLQDGFEIKCNINIKDYSNQLVKVK
jgi:hypothetical protein